MRNLFGLLFVCAFFVLTSCGDSVCDQDLAGTYTGTQSCAGNENDATLIIGGTQGSYTVSGVVSNSSIHQDGCKLLWSNSLFNVGEDVTITFDGNTAKVKQELTAYTCTFTGTK